MSRIIFFVCECVLIIILCWGGVTDRELHLHNWREDVSDAIKEMKRQLNDGSVKTGLTIGCEACDRHCNE